MRKERVRVRGFCRRAVRRFCFKLIFAGEGFFLFLGVEVFRFLVLYRYYCCRVCVGGCGFL